MWKLLFRIIIRLFNGIASLFYPLSSGLKKLNEFIYSEKYCQVFKCKDVCFKRPINTVIGQQYFSIGLKTCFGKCVVLTAWDFYENQKFSPEVKIGVDCNFGDYLHLTCIDKIIIGNNVLTGRWVTITDNSHGKSDFITESIPPIKRKLYSKGPIIIEDNVWIGDKATILPGVTIGKNSIIAANSVVTKDIPENSVAAGNPIKIIKKFQNE